MSRMQAKPAKPLKPRPNSGSETRDTDGADLGKTPAAQASAKRGDGAARQSR